MAQKQYDYIIIGGGFYGCCLALFLRSLTRKILIIEAEAELMNRASKVNQARIHTGFHYPRNFVTALRSAALRQQFMQDFPEAVVKNFNMLYAIARRQSKVNAKRFFKMFSAMNVPIKAANSIEKSFFNSAYVEEVFACEEFAFNYETLKCILQKSLQQAGIDIDYCTTVTEVLEDKEYVHIVTQNQKNYKAKIAFNVTYAQINHILTQANQPLMPIKYEWAEVALITPPATLKNYGITVMDGPFFSTMPFPASVHYSLTHVRYTPHHAWSGKHHPDAYAYARTLPQISRAGYMLQDAQRFVPSLSQSAHQKSLFDVKTVLIKNETDDGRPILYSRPNGSARLITVMGAKIDNIYDLFASLNSEPEFKQATPDYLRPNKSKVSV